MVLKTTKKATNGAVHRHQTSWIDSFVELTKGTESAPIFRRWSAITTIAGVLQQKVWAELQGTLYPNLYVFLIGEAGIGKSRPINIAQRMVMGVKEVALSPTSVTMASLVDKLVESKRAVTVYPPPSLEYNSLYVVVDELSNLMNNYKEQNELIGGLTKFYDCSPYSQARRVGNIERDLAKPQLTIIAGSTPSNLLKFIPDWAWDQGFTSRIIMVFSKEKFIINPFNTPKFEIPEEMIEDLRTMDTLIGAFGWTQEYADAMNAWRESGMEPEPKHPKLKSYNARRWAHLIKLTMIASVDRGMDLTLTVADMARAQEWILEAEHSMPDIFQSGATSTDSKAIEDILHFIENKGPTGVPEHQIKNFAMKSINARDIVPTLTLMEEAGMIKTIGRDKIGLKIMVAVRP